MDNNLRIKKCKWCGRSFKQKKEWQKYDSPQCKGAAAYERRASLIRQARKMIQAQLEALEELVEWASHRVNPNAPKLKAAIVKARAAIALATQPDIDPVTKLPFNRD
jgi:hypothetical protein